MVNSHTGLMRARKDEELEFALYVDELKNGLDITQVAYQYGININKYGKAECFNGHDSKTPSLTFYEDTQSYHCFGCEAHGDVISLVQHIEDCSFVQAVNTLAGVAGLPSFQPENRSYLEHYASISECLKTAAQIYHSWLSSDDPYLAQRGISYETARQFLMGRTRGKTDLFEKLEEKGFTTEIMVQSGLVKDDHTDFFQNHVVVPILSSGRVVNFYGRHLNNEHGQRHWRLPNNPYSLFNYSYRAKEIILVEGIFDALALIAQGFPHTVATLGTQGLNGAMPAFEKSNIKKVFICYDGDPAGNSAAARSSHVLEDAGISTRVVSMPDGEDPNSFLQKHSEEDFRKLLDASLSPFDCEIKKIIEKEKREDQLVCIRDELLPRVRKADPILQPDLIKKIHAAFDIPVKNLNEQLKQIQDRTNAEKKDLIEIGSLKIINPALDMVDSTMVIMAPVRVLDKESHVPRWQNTVITSNRERFALTHEELLKKGWYNPALERTDIRVAEERYSATILRDFLAGSASGDLKQTFKDIRSAIQRYIDFSDPRTYDFLTCWTIGTYFFPIFSHYPYVHFTGPKGSGKSQCLHVLRCLCHNAKIAGSMTLAVQFRIIGALQPTLLFDEMENLGQTQHTELHRMLKYGFEKNGPEVWRMESSGNRMEMNSWSVYCPRAFASIEGMEEVIASRSVQVIMERSFSEEVKNRTVNADDLLWQQLRDQLFLVVMNECTTIKTIYDLTEKPSQLSFSGRDWDIFKGILAVARAVGSEVHDTVISFAVDTHASKVQKDHDNSPDMIILNHLSETVTSADWYELGTLHQGLIEKASAQGLDLQGTMTKERFGKRLASLKVYEKRNRATRNGEI